VRVAVGLMLVALGMGLAFDAGRQSVRPSVAMVPSTATAESSPVADRSHGHLDTMRQTAPALQAVPLGRRVPTENACGGCHRIADPPIQARPRPMM
jgi:hypothetical protein